MNVVQAPLGEGGMLDEAGQAQLAHGRSGGGLGLVQAVGGVAQRIALLAEEGQEQLALVDEGGYESGHGVISVPAGPRPARFVGDAMVRP